MERKHEHIARPSTIGICLEKGHNRARESDELGKKKMPSVPSWSAVLPGEHMVLSSGIGVGGVCERERRKKGEAEQSNRGRK